MWHHGDTLSQNCQNGHTLGPITLKNVTFWENWQNSVFMTPRLWHLGVTLFEDYGSIRDPSVDPYCTLCQKGRFWANISETGHNQVRSDNLDGFVRSITQNVSKLSIFVVFHEIHEIYQKSRVWACESVCPSVRESVYFRVFPCISGYYRPRRRMHGISGVTKIMKKIDEIHENRWNSWSNCGKSRTTGRVGGGWCTRSSTTVGYHGPAHPITRVPLPHAPPSAVRPLYRWPCLRGPWSVRQAPFGINNSPGNPFMSNRDVNKPQKHQNGGFSVWNNLIFCPKLLLS